MAAATEGISRLQVVTPSVVADEMLKWSGVKQKCIGMRVGL